MIDNKAHSKIGASGMHRWAECPGSVNLAEKIGNITSAYAAEGTLAHAILELRLLNKPTPGFVVGSTHKVEGHDIEVTEEMLEAVEVAVDYINTKRTPQRWREWVEYGFDLSELHPGLYGTADFVGYQEYHRELYVYDYKHGSGIPVKVEGNPQLMYYALGALLTTKVPAKKVVLGVIQPRCDHEEGVVREWEISTLELLDFSGELVEKAKATEAPDAPLNPGAWCRFCPAAGTCPALFERAQLTAKAEFSPALSYDPVQLSTTLAKLHEVEAWVKAVREFAYGEAQHGRCPPGWKLVAKRAVRQWHDDAKVVKKLLSHQGVCEDDIYTQKLLSPAQAEKLFGGKKKLPADIAEEIVAISSGDVLAPEDDPRPPIVKSAEIEFASADLLE